MGPETTFFSYARSDSDFVLKLARDLRQAGADIWLDKLDIKAGSRWDLSVETALENSTKMVVILSPDSVASHNVMDEVFFALEEGKTVIPVLLKTCVIPFRLRRLQHADFTDNYEEGLENLMRALNLEKLIPGLPGKDDSKPAIKAAQKSEKDEIKKKAEDEMLIAKAEAKRLEEQRKLKEQAEAERLEEERKFKEQAETERQEEKLKYKEQAKEIKIDNIPKINTEASNLIKNKYKIPILIAGIFAILVIVIWIVNSRKNDNGNFAIGQEYQGGIIFYIDASGQHGLIAATFDQSDGIEWGDEYTLTEATGKEIGTGKSNTDLIVAKLGEGDYAAKLCADIVLNGYDDWFLPSIDELNQLYKNRNKVGGFTNNAYWSSSESNKDGAWFQNFSKGSHDPFLFYKSTTFFIRAIRAF